MSFWSISYLPTRPESSAGLLFPSVATSIIRTIKQDMINKRLGSLQTQDMEAIDSKLKLALGL